MEIQEKLIDGVSIISVTGSIDALTAPEISEQIDTLVSRGENKIIADFEGVDYTSSAGLRVLLSAVKQTRAAGGDFYLVNIQPDVEKVLKLSGFTSILNIFKDVDTALKGFSEE